MQLSKDPVLGHIAQTTRDVAGGSKQMQTYVCRPEEESGSSWKDDIEGQKIVLIVVVVLAILALGLKFP